MVRAVVIGCCVVLAAAPAFAQSTSPGCGKPVSTAAPTPPRQGDGTAPGSSGSTGWTGGTGGSFVGTTQAGGSYQPATARGLDPLTSLPKPC